MAITLQSTPAADGFRMPGEFEAHERCWMLWPVRPDNWRDNAAPAQAAFARVARTIGGFEPVTVGAPPDHLKRARSLLGDGVDVVAMEYDDAWMRDTGPCFLIDGERRRLRGTDWRFNAWGGESGGLYASWERDATVAGHVLSLVDCERYAPDLVLEGGSIEVDGEGTLITTEECLLNPNRNPQRSREEIERCLRDYLGVERIVWLGQGVHQDETDGHVDNLCRFVAPAEVALTWTDDPDDPQYAISRDAERRLLAGRDARGRRFTVHRLHQPGPLFMSEAEARGLKTAPGTKPRPAGDRLAGSYVNFYIANGAVVMPVFDDPHDDEAVRVMKGIFPQRRVVTVPGREILLGGGNIHCITQQQPRVEPLV